MLKRPLAEGGLTAIGKTLQALEEVEAYSLCHVGFGFPAAHARSHAEADIGTKSRQLTVENCADRLLVTIPRLGDECFRFVLHTNSGPATEMCRCWPRIDEMRRPASVFAEHVGQISIAARPNVFSFLPWSLFSPLLPSVLNEAQPTLPHKAHKQRIHLELPHRDIDLVALRSSFDLADPQ